MHTHTQTPIQQWDLSEGEKMEGSDSSLQNTSHMTSI